MVEKNPWSYRFKTWYAYTTSLSEQHWLGPTWPHTLLSLCKTKNAKNGISVITSNLGHYTHEPIYIWNQYNLGNVFKCMYMTTLISVFMSGSKKGQKWYFGQTTHMPNEKENEVGRGIMPLVYVHLSFRFSNSVKTYISRGKCIALIRIPSVHLDFISF